MSTENQYQEALVDSLEEILRAKRVHGPTDFNSIHEGFAILQEEVDELWEEVKRNPYKTGDGGRIAASAIELRQNALCSHRQAMRKEAIQVAAMAIRFAAEVC